MCPEGGVVTWNRELSIQGYLVEVSAREFDLDTEGDPGRVTRVRLAVDLYAKAGQATEYDLISQWVDTVRAEQQPLGPRSLPSQVVLTLLPRKEEDPE